MVVFPALSKPTMMTLCSVGKVKEKVKFICCHFHLSTVWSCVTQHHKLNVQSDKIKPGAGLVCSGVCGTTVVIPDVFMSFLFNMFGWEWSFTLVSVRGKGNIFQKCDKALQKIRTSYFKAVVFFKLSPYFIVILSHLGYSPSDRRWQICAKTDREFEKCKNKSLLPVSQNTAIIFVSRNPMFNKCVCGGEWWINDKSRQTSVSVNRWLSAWVSAHI